MAITIPATTPVRSPPRRRPRRIVSQTVPSPARIDGIRAVSEATPPNGAEQRAISQKKSGGLSVVTTPLTCGTSHWPSASISRAPSAKYGSSGAQRS